MPGTPTFFDIYKGLTFTRLVAISILFLIGAGILYYFNRLGKVLDQREKRYAALYAEAIRFTIEQDIEDDCDYTFVSEVVDANESIPTILVTNGIPTYYRNIPELEDSAKTASLSEKNLNDILYLKIAEMKEEHEPIEILMGGGPSTQRAYLYYSSSLTLKELRFFPYILIGTFLVLGSLAYIAYNSSRIAEQNRVWVGLAKETAHQLGTPISALLGWIEVLRTYDNFDGEIGKEMEKDILRLETITNRFSNIGSVPVMKPENIGELVIHAAGYLEKRISTKVHWEVKNHLPRPVLIPINKNLFEWVIENLCKNAVDAMSAEGVLSIDILPLANGNTAIDISDTGKGLSRSQMSKVFKPGYTTKKRGWGLGLTLAKRIIETYHKGRLSIKNSKPGVGTTFRIQI